MVNKNSTKYEDFKAELLRRPSVRKEYEALRPKYDIIRSVIDRRIQLRMSQKRLAELVGTKQPAISRLEKGDSDTTLSTFFKVANVLELDVSIRPRPKAGQVRDEVVA